MAPEAALHKLLKTCQAGIWYAPLADEADPNAAPWLADLDVKKEIVPQNAGADPFALAEFFAQSYGRANLFILVPGRRFDAFGNRKGHGRGWYDRFLSAVPRHWIRIGVTRRADLSELRLDAQAWDEAMDWIICRGGDVWSVLETNARPPDTRQDTNRLSA